MRSFINCRAPHTRFGGAIMAEEVLRAIAEAAAGMTYAAAPQWFLNSDPSILMAGARGGISLSTGMLAPGQEDLVAAQLRRCLARR